RLPTLDFDLLSKVDGEIKVALNKIKDNTEHLLESPVNGEQRSKLLTIGARRELLMSLTDDILDYSKLASGKMIFASEDFDLRETVTSAVESLASYAEQKGSALRTSIGELPRKLCGDRNRLSQMLTHFIRAAVELLRPGDVVLNVAADSPGDGGKLPVRFEIPLPGADLTAETRESFMMPPMTEELGEADTGTSRLGLALAARIIQAMGGAVSIEDLRETGPVLTACVEFEPASAEKRSTRLDCPSLDPAVLADIRGLPGTANTNEGVFRDLVTVFLRYLPARLENLDNAMSEGNGLSLARQTHALRGACAGMGAARLALLCAEVETLAENNDTEAARPILLEIRKEAECVRGLLQLECERQQASEIAAAHTV
ncbi:MAG TPA: Hpt domain-containing protein, partial [Candidatus Binataceae bacterium]|nr:Hpt domain-containing protein [Candidatus Binataceae bacterium]